MGLEFTVDQAMLLGALKAAGEAVARTSTLPVFTHYLLQSDDSGRLLVAGNNLQFAIMAYVPAMITETGGVTVPAELFFNWVSGMAGTQIAGSVSESNWRLTCKAMRYRTGFNGLSPEEYPRLTEKPLDIKPICFKPVALTRMIDATAFSAADDQSRPQLTAINITVHDGKAVWTTTDQYRMSEYVTDSDLPSGSTVLMPASSAAKLSRIMGGCDPDTDIECHIMANHILFILRGRDETFDEILFSSHLVAGKPIDLSRFVPRSHKTSAMVDTAQMIKAMKISNLFARDANSNVSLIVIPAKEQDGAGSIRLESESESGINTADIDAIVEGPEIKLTMSSKYALDALAAITAPQVCFEFTAPNQAVAIKPASDEQFTHVMMPRLATR